MMTLVNLLDGSSKEQFFLYWWLHQAGVITQP